MLRCDRQLKPRASPGDGGAHVAEQAPRTQGARWRSLLGAVPVCAEVWHVRELICLGTLIHLTLVLTLPLFIKHLPHAKHSAQTTSPSAHPRHIPALRER